MENYFKQFVSNVALISSLCFAIFFLFRALEELFNFPKLRHVPWFKKEKLISIHLSTSPKTTLCLFIAIKCLLSYTALWWILFTLGPLSYLSVNVVIGKEIPLLYIFAALGFTCLMAILAFHAAKRYFCDKDALFLGIFPAVLFPLERLFLLIVAIYLAEILILCLLKKKTFPQHHLSIQDRTYALLSLFFTFVSTYIFLYLRFFHIL